MGVFEVQPHGLGSSSGKSWVSSTFQRKEKCSWERLVAPLRSQGWGSPMWKEELTCTPCVHWGVAFLGAREAAR